MAQPLRPAPVSTYQRENWIFLTGTASAAYIPTAAEVNAASSLDITLIAFADTGRPAQSTNRITQERRLGDGSLFEDIGATTYTGGDCHYAFDPQAATGTNGKKWFEKIPTGTTGVLVQRLGIAIANIAATGQFVHAYPVRFGPSFPLQAGDGETSQAGMTATFAVIDQPAISVALT